MQNLIKMMGERLGIVVEANSNCLKVLARHEGVEIGDIFLMPSRLESFGQGTRDRRYFIQGHCSNRPVARVQPN